jgi:hypothetical protein
MGLINREGQIVIEPKYDLICDFAEGMALAATRDKIVGLDATGRHVFEIDAPGGDREVHPFSDGLALVAFDHEYDLRDLGKVVHMKHKMYNYVTKTGKLLLNEPVGRAEAFQGGVALVGRGLDWNIIDSKGRMLLDEDARIVTRDEDAGGFRVDGGVVDTTGRWIVSPRFADVGPFRDGLAVAIERRGGTKKWKGVIDRKGRWIIPPKYLWIGQGDDGTFTATTTGNVNYSGRHTDPNWWVNGTWFIFDCKGKVLAKLGKRAIPPGLNREGLIRFADKVSAARAP